MQFEVKETRSNLDSLDLLYFQLPTCTLSLSSQMPLNPLEWDELHSSNIHSWNGFLLSLSQVSHLTVHGWMRHHHTVRLIN